jgi:small-conductance mechanosensitive channel
MSLGNEKPEFLSKTEKAAWRAILRIACGHSAHSEMKIFLDYYNSLANTVAPTNEDLNWYCPEGEH